MKEKINVTDIAVSVGADISKDYKDRVSYTFNHFELARFASMVEEHEREECAKVCDEKSMDERDGHDMRVIESCARMIRSRMQQK